MATTSKKKGEPKDKAAPANEPDAAHPEVAAPAKRKAAAKPKKAASAAPDVNASAAPDASAEEPAPQAKAKPRAAAKKKAAAALPDGDAAQATAAPVEATVAAAAEASVPTAADPVSTLAGPAFPDTRYELVEKLLVGFLAHEVRKVGLGRAVLGLSGGVDSAVSAAIAARALGPQNVLGVIMPYQSSSPESLADANAVAAALGIETLVVEITAQVDAYFDRFPEASRLRRGNKMARERMTILYDHSAARSALVIGTSNKTELLLGYGTLYGDMASALNPIGDLYKTQVWGLARHLGLPASVIEKAPTADLWTGQTDENELGFSYHQVDRLLYRMIDERCSTAELLEMGFGATFLDRIARMVRSSQFKRRLPVIAKLSARSIDTDFRYSRDWGL